MFLEKAVGICFVKEASVFQVAAVKMLCATSGDDKGCLAGEVVDTGFPRVHVTNFLRSLLRLFFSRVPVYYPYLAITQGSCLNEESSRESSGMLVG